jgi:predicted glycogen debranching enzyme
MSSPSAEWLEADGLGGFASGSAGGERTRRYHGLLLVATTPPTGRVMLVNGVDAWVETPGGRIALSSQRYAPDVVQAAPAAAFTPDPWPRWTYAVGEGCSVVHELFVRRDAPVVALSWRLTGELTGARLAVRPLVSGRDIHALHHENPAFRFDPVVRGGHVVWRPYAGVPEIVAAANGEYRHEPAWYRRFLYTEERDRGLDDIEDLASPGIFEWDLARGQAILLLTVPGHEAPDAPDAWYAGLAAAEAARRRAFPSRLHRAADTYVVRRGAGKTIVAGYPWFTDWGRDTFIALRGLSLATGRRDEARAILLEWAGAVSEGMLPNRFPDRGETPEFNAVDASLWYAVAVQELLAAAGSDVAPGDRRTLQDAVLAILAGYARGTRYGIRADEDGLLAAGEPGVQLTWMDAKVGDWVVTPRIGKPVEVQALWLSALRFASSFAEGWSGVFERGRQSFAERFWNEERGMLHDVVDVDHRPGTADPTFRPNQVFAVGGLPLALLDGERARRVVDAVEQRLWTPLGLRSLAPGEPGYSPRYTGGVCERDGAYHQGTVWPWLLGPFVEAWVRVRGGTPAVKREARARFLDPLRAHLDEAGLGHVSEIADAEPPHVPRGCPFQAWSVGEALRLAEVVLAAG